MKMQIHVEDRIVRDIDAMADFVKANPDHPFTRAAARVGEIDPENITEITSFDGERLTVTLVPQGDLATLIGLFNQVRDDG